MKYDSTKEMYLNKFLGTREICRNLKNRYNDLVRNTYELMEDLYSKESILNFSKYIEQRKKLRQLKSIYKVEKDNKPSLTYKLYDLKDIDKLLAEQSESSLLKTYAKCYYDSQNAYYKRKVLIRIDEYEKIIQKYVKRYNRYMAKINRVIATYDKGFAKRNAHQKLDLIK